MRKYRPFESNFHKKKSNCVQCKCQNWFVIFLWMYFFAFFNLLSNEIPLESLWWYVRFITPIFLWGKLEALKGSVKLNYSTKISLGYFIKFFYFQGNFWWSSIPNWNLSQDLSNDSSFESNHGHLITIRSRLNHNQILLVLERLNIDTFSLFLQFLFISHLVGHVSYHFKRNSIFN